MDDLLYTLETQTAGVLRACADGKPWPAELVEARQSRIVQLCEMIQKGVLVSEAQLGRIRTIEKEGVAILASLRAAQEGLLESVSVASRQESYAKCVETILDLSEAPELISPRSL